jgi:PIN domain nuclease of toxin-antitoxin system
MNDLLLDTCAVLWLAKGTEIKADVRETILESDLHMSLITAWEIANLARRNRIALAMPAAPRFREAVRKMGAAVTQLTIDNLTASCFLPGSPPSDPADRIIIATAREHGLSIVTRDRMILAYSDAGHVRAMAC